MEAKPIQETIKTMQAMKNYSAVSTGSKITSDVFKAKIFEVCPEFKIDEHTKPVMNSLFFYVNDEITTIDPKKGILLWGDIGTGKSTIIKILGELLRLKNQGYLTMNCSYLATQYSSIGLEALNTSTYNESDRGISPVNRAFDELGREPIPAKHFGTELNVMQYIFQCRYELRDKVRTFATTNLRPEALEKIYGAYISDRINEMFNIIQITGKTRRKN